MVPTDRPPRGFLLSAIGDVFIGFAHRFCLASGTSGRTASNRSALTHRKRYWLVCTVPLKSAVSAVRHRNTKRTNKRTNPPTVTLSHCLSCHSIRVVFRAARSILLREGSVALTEEAKPSQAYRPQWAQLRCGMVWAAVWVSTPEYGYSSMGGRDCTECATAAADAAADARLPRRQDDCPSRVRQRHGTAL